ncbi:hypothetical protein [Prevotella sp. ne3005]|uniref:hypothetical protein n=1 Tax=Prevotella sp. ne3005 TaxID=1761887 RepID=UPI001113D5E8|nr:hypothetical protein [Prevotella sp. ne3005]
MKDIQTVEYESGIEILRVFEIPDSYVHDILQWIEIEADLDLKKLEEYLVYAGKKSEIYLTLLKHYEKEIVRFDNESKSVVIDIYPSNEWRVLLQSGYDATNLAGYLTLLQMDALASLISIIKASSDTERIMLSKHAYTIMYEALEKNLYKIVSCRMRQFPERLADKDVLSDLWKGIKRVSKLMIKKNEAEFVRNTIDSHQRDSFSEQIEAYKNCDFGMSVKSMWAMIRIVDLIQSYIDLINKNIRVCFDECGKEWENRIKVLEDIAEKLRDLKTANHESLTL